MYLYFITRLYIGMNMKYQEPFYFILYSLKLVNWCIILMMITLGTQGHCIIPMILFHAAGLC